jgi:hypothetical protein
MVQLLITMHAATHFACTTAPRRSSRDHSDVAAEARKLGQPDRKRL